MFEALNNFFDKIYVITLQRATDRHLQIEEQLKGLHFSFLYGMDKINIDKEEWIANGNFDPKKAKQHHIMSREMTLGEMGCAMSHRMVYEDVVKNKYERVLIMEDDIIIDRKNIGLFNTIAAELPDDWDLWYLGFAKNEQPPSNANVKKLFYHLLFTLGLKTKLNHTAINNLYPVQFSKHLKKAGFHDCAHAYAITFNVANILLQKQTPLSYIADHLLGYAICERDLNGYISFPKMINQQYQIATTPIKSYINQ